MNMIATCDSDTIMGKASKSPDFDTQDRYKQDVSDDNETGSQCIKAGTHTRLEGMVRIQ